MLFVVSPGDGLSPAGGAFISGGPAGLRSLHPPEAMAGSTKHKNASCGENDFEQSLIEILTNLKIHF